MALNIAQIALSLVPRIGHKTLTALHATFGDYDAILNASSGELTAVYGIGNKTAAAIQAIELHRFEQQVIQWQTQAIQIIPLGAPDYPAVLSTIDDPPLVLFVRGQYQPVRWQPAVAIIGTRHATTMSRAFAQQLAEAYADRGWTVVSGLALGIDSAAHLGALQVPDGMTVAVLGGGVGNIYPPKNHALAERILQAGALISENAPDATAIATRLVMRNRILSGLAQRVIVVQSSVDGGAMHAARFAQAQGRELYTVDWHFTGNQALLNQGAKPVNPHHPVIPSA